jgi:uncharacterized protein (TIGR03083 family)
VGFWTVVTVGANHDAPGIHQRRLGGQLGLEISPREEMILANDASVWVAAVRRSHDQVAARTATLDADTLRINSYCPGWDIAQVLSHLGSQAEMFELLLEAGLTGGEPPGPTDMPAIWDVWNNRTPLEQAGESTTRNEQFVDRLEALDETQVSSFRVTAFHRELDLVGLLRMRLFEHAIHAWDIAVSFEPGAVVDQSSVDLLVDGLAGVAARASKPLTTSATLHIITTDPDREFALTTSRVSLEPWADQASTGTLRLSAEALLRLVYGRLDPAHTPPLALDSVGTDLDQLREIFPGF